MYYFARCRLFSSGNEEFKKLKLVDTIYDFYKSKKLIVGICLGMQLLFEESLEIKKTKGLGLIKGKVTTSSFNNKKAINIGWEKVFVRKKKCFSFKRKYEC